MANEPKELNVGGGITTETVYGGGETKEGSVGTEAKESAENKEISNNINKTEEKAIVNDTKKSLKVSEDAPKGKYADEKALGGTGQSKGKKAIVNTVTVNEVKCLIEKRVKKVPTPIDELPPIEEGDADKALCVKHDETGVEWKKVQAPLTFDTKPTEDSANPITSGGVYEALQELEEDNCVVTLSGPNYDDEEFTLDEFIAKCEAGDFVDGDDVDEEVTTIASITNLINGQTYRLRLIGVNHDVIATTDLGELEPNGTKAKTTWQFYGMPLKSVKLGLQFMGADPMEGATYGPWTGQFDGNYPCNWSGYLACQLLLRAMDEIFFSLPKKLQNAIKMVRKDLHIPVICFDDYEPYNSTATMIEYENDRYGSLIAAKLFCLSASEVGIIPNPNATDIPFPYTCEYTDWDTETQEECLLEGFKYSYFHEGYAYQSETEGHYTRPCVYNDEPWWYWLRSPYLLNSFYWGIVNGSGGVYGYYTYDHGGVAPAFCI